MFKSMFGKYRFLVVSIALFLIFDLGVLVLNFYTSGKIAEQAELINLAGRQRTLTQQMSKATLYIKAQKLQQWVYQSGLDELRDHYQVFSDTLQVFNDGGTIESANTGQPITIERVTAEEGRAILNQATQLWRAFDQALAPLMVDVLITDEEIRPASAFIAANNGKLFDHMDNLTEYFTAAAERQTNFLRQAQVIGISLATINFFIILFHFIGQLRGRDLAIEHKQSESDKILSTIGDGVFLLDEDLRMSGQHSKQLQTIFSTKKISGRKFKRFLQSFFPQQTVDTAIDFVRLYYKSHIDPELIQDVNPLRRVEASITLDDGSTQSKYLDFSFAKLASNKRQTSQLLVSVTDVTAAILLEAQDQAVQNEMNQQMALLTQILPIPAHDLDDFTREATVSFDRINALLKDTKHVSDNYAKTITRIAREAHKLKGNAAALKLELIAEQLHEFEDNLQALREQSRIKQLSGREFLPLTLKLKQGYEALDMVRELRSKLDGYSLETPSSLASIQPHNRAEHQPEENRKWFDLENVIARFAADAGVGVNLSLRGFNDVIEPTITTRLYPLAIQLIRNAIAHGIEPKSTRQTLKKPDLGHISISLSHDKLGNYRFLFEDDGRGFDYESIRTSIVAHGLLNEGEARALGNTGLIRYAFKDAISSLAKANAMAGRGTGLALVWQQVRALNGKLKIRSVEQEFTQFIIDFPFQNDDGESSDTSSHCQSRWGDKLRAKVS